MTKITECAVGFFAPVPILDSLLPSYTAYNEQKHSKWTHISGHRNLAWRCAFCLPCKHPFASLWAENRAYLLMAIYPNSFRIGHSLQQCLAVIPCLQTPLIQFLSHCLGLIQLKDSFVFARHFTHQPLRAVWLLYVDKTPYSEVRHLSTHYLEVHLVLLRERGIQQQSQDSKEKRIQRKGWENEVEASRKIRWTNTQNSHNQILHF